MMRDKPQVLRTCLPYSLYVAFLLVTALPVTLLSNCGGSRATQYYVLNSSPANARAEAQQAKPVSPTAAMTTISIRQIDIPQYLDRPRMVRRDVGNQLKIAEYHQWGGHLRDNIARTMADNLAVRISSATVSMAPFPGSAGAGIAVLLDIRQFERMPDGFVHMQVQWYVERRDGSVFSKLEHLKSEAHVDRDDYAGMANAMSSLLGQVSDHLAVAIQGMKPEVKG